MYCLSICWYNLLVILKKEAVCSFENFVIICQTTVSHNPQNRSMKVTAVNILCTILKVNSNLSVHEIL